MFVFRPEVCNFLVAFLHRCPLLLSYDCLLATFTSWFLSSFMLLSFLISPPVSSNPQRHTVPSIPAVSTSERPVLGIVAPSITSLFILSSLFNQWNLMLKLSTRKLRGSTCVWTLVGFFLCHIFVSDFIAWWRKSHSCLTKPGKRANISRQFKTTDWAKCWGRPAFSGKKYWSRLLNSVQPLNGAVLYINEGKVRRVYTRLKPPENSDPGSAKIECNSLQGRHLWHLLFAKPCRYSSMTGSLSGVVFWVPGFILLIISSLSRSLNQYVPNFAKIYIHMFWRHKKNLVSMRVSLFQSVTHKNIQFNWSLISLGFI